MSIAPFFSLQLARALVLVAAVIGGEEGCSLGVVSLNGVYSRTHNAKGVLPEMTWRVGLRFEIVGIGIFMKSDE